MDDTFTALPKDLVDPFLDQLNGIELSINFTVEKEKHGRLVFLDVQLCGKDDSTRSTAVYCKLTHTNQHLSFKSHHLTAHKVAVLRTLMTRVEQLSSLGVEQAEEEKQDVDALRQWLSFWVCPQTHHL